MSVLCECCVLPVRGLCVGSSLVQTNPAECGVSGCDREASVTKWPWLTSGFAPRKGKKMNYVCIVYRFLYTV
jgi:hypothetical protein